MGTVGWQETVVIFILALVLFGPKKLPELGRTLGKAITEFRRASNELKSTFDREMKNLEQETQPVKQALNEYQYDTYNYDYATGMPYDHSYGAGESEFSASHPQITSASAPEGAESTSSVSPEGTVAYGVKTEAAHEAAVAHGTPVPEAAAPPEIPAPVSTATEHKA
jgi:sec-independent protein translocase protein TatA